MDPVSQGALGAVAAMSLAHPAQIRFAALAGCVGGLLADLDVFITSESDPLLYVEYHRHFSHSLAFIPVGGLIAAILLWPIIGKRLSFLQLYFFTVLGYSTSGLLDACTSYGTHLLWPFSESRISWSIISIVDPIFTLPLVFLIAIGVFKKSPLFSRIAILFGVIYLSIGVLQNFRASAFQEQLAHSRGHQNITRGTVKPSLANLILWRSVYRYEDFYYVDALRVGFKTPKLYQGGRVAAFDVNHALDKLSDGNPLAEDLRRFDHFSDGYLARLPDEPGFITDLRYSAIPNQISPLWGLNLNELNDSGHAAFETRRKISPSERDNFLQMLLGKD